MATVHALPDTDALHTAAAQTLGDALAAACAARAGRIGWVVSGGRTPGAVLPQVLARSDIDWARVDTVASDERLVAPEDPASTETMVRGLFTAAERPCHYVGFGADPAPDAALAHWRAGLEAMAWPPEVAFLGMGDDAHTASLFPGRAEAGDETLFAAAVPETPPHVAPRLTLGLRALAACRQIVLVANSPAKIARLDAARAPDADPRTLPVAGILRLVQTTVFRT